MVHAASGTEPRGAPSAGDWPGGAGSREALASVGERPAAVHASPIFAAVDGYARVHVHSGKQKRSAGDPGGGRARLSGPGAAAELDPGWTSCRRWFVGALCD